MLGANGIVAASLPIAVGASLRRQQRSRHNDQVVAAFFGDGATNEGAFHEAANLASAWRLPVVFVCENNYYGGGHAARRGFRERERSVERGAARMHGMPAISRRRQRCFSPSASATRGGRRARPQPATARRFLECRNRGAIAPHLGEVSNRTTGTKQERNDWLSAR